MIALRLSAFYGIFFMFVGVLLPYWPVWLDSRGLGPEQIGLVLAASQWIKVLAHPLIASRADRHGRPRELTAALAATAAAAILALGWVDGFVAILLLSALGTAAFAPILPVGESIALRAVTHHGIDYGRVRLWGSITFIAAASGLGLLLEEETADRIRLAMLALALATIVACLALPEMRRKAAAPSDPGSPPTRPWTLLARPSFLLFLGVAGCLQASHSVLYAFASIEWRNAGIDATVIGLLWSWGVVAEVALFAIAGRFKTVLTPRALLTVAAVGAVVRWPLMALTTDPWLLFPLQSLHALTFGAAHLGAMGWLRENVPEEMGATGQSLYYALVGGVITGIAMGATGELYAAVGSAAYFAMGGLGLVALATLVATRARPEQHRRGQN
jgi:PPP family 3-phenylpropionic acid transporter